MSIAYRLMEPVDRNFVISGWSTSFRTSYDAGLIAMSDWADVMHEQIGKILDRPDCVTLLAYDPDESDRVADLAGFLCFDNLTTPPVVWYCYVKGPRRRCGIARGLMRMARIDPAKPLIYVCRTPMRARIRDKTPGAMWRPLIARFPPGATITDERDNA